jgi:hypothetical protein
MFSVHCGWLKYKPHQQFKLPRLIHRYEKDHQGFESGKPIQALFVRKGDPQVAFSRPLYELEWPGTMQVKEGSTEWGDWIPDDILGNIKGFEHLKPNPNAHPDHHKDSGHTLRRIIQENLTPLPRRIPDSIAYHLAVNRNLYYGPNSIPKHPVAGLPETRLTQVLSGHFALNSSYHTAITYLKWLGETHWQHPFLGDFDTNVREELAGIAIKAIQLYFYLLGDCLYDPDTKWFSRHGVKSYWQYLANYLWWIGRTGGGLYADHAGLTESRSDVTKMPPDVMECMREWEQNLEKSRMVDHVEGPPIKDPKTVQETTYVYPEIKYTQENSDVIPTKDAPVVYLNQDFSYEVNTTDEKRVYPPVVKIDLIWPKGTPDKTIKAEYKTEKKRLRTGLVVVATQAFTQCPRLPTIEVTEFVIQKARWSMKGECHTVQTHFALTATQTTGN